jgi:hypothetical protein
MSDWAVGLSTGCFWQTSIFDCLEEIRNSGFGRIEICSNPAHLDYHDCKRVQHAARLAEDLGLVRDLLVPRSVFARDRYHLF